MNYLEVILQIELELNLKNKNLTYNSEKFRDFYLESLHGRNKICEKCEEWKNLGLPYDCLSKPIYCVKNENDLLVIKKYEELIS